MSQADTNRNGTVAGVLDNLDNWRAELEHFQLASGDDLQELDRSIIDARRGRLDQPPAPTLTILLLGASGAGKSEVLNALAGERIAVSHHVRPTTRRPTIYAHEALPPERLFDYGPVLGELAKDPGSYRTHRREELRHKIIIDAPDIDSYETGHRDLVLSLLPAVDIAMYVVTAYNYKDDIGWQIVLSERGRRAFAFIINKWDPEGKPNVPPGSPDVDEDMRSLLRRGGWDEPMIFRTSARHWIGRRSGESEFQGNPPPGDQFPELERWLSAGLSTSQIEQIQRRRRRSLWGALSASASRVIPPDFSKSTWPMMAQAELSVLREEGWHLLRPSLQLRAASLAAIRDRARRPESPGPFGIMQRLVGGVSAGARNLNKVRNPALLAAPVSALSAGSQSVMSPTKGAAGEETGVVSIGQVSSFAERRLAGLEWRGRESQFPVEWVAEQWRSTGRQLHPVLADSVDVVSAELTAQAVGKGRKAAGIVVTAVVELAVTAVIVMAVYNLGRGFITGSYLGFEFVLNLLALLACVFLLGQFMIALLVPRSESGFRRELEGRVGGVWRKHTKQFEAQLAEFLNQYSRLRSDGNDLVKKCGAETQRLTNEISAASHDGDPAEQLFGHFEQHAGSGR